jgi:hypothetical protein
MLRVHSQGRADEEEELFGSQSDKSYTAVFAAGGFTVIDPAVEYLRASELLCLVRTGALTGAYVPGQHRGYVGETPVEGAGARARWLALHDRAVALRAVLRPGDIVGQRQVHRALRSVLLYEHQLSGQTRRQVRSDLWRRDRSDEPLPPFVERVRWARCRCGQCTEVQP